MKKSKLWIPVVAIVLSLAVIAGILIVPRLPKEEVAVFPVNMVGYTDYYSGTSESYGMVTTDKVQSLFLSDTQTITEILVYPGQSVKKGDVLFTYDTTLSDLAIERKDLANQQLEVELKTANAELAALRKMKPIVYKPGSSSSSTAKTDYTKSPSDKNKLNTVYSTKTTGKSSLSPLYFWLATTKQVDDALIEQLFREVGESNYVYVVFQLTPGNATGKEFNVHTGIKFTKILEPEPTTPPTTPPTEPSTEPSTAPSEPSGEIPTTPAESEPTKETEETVETEPPTVETEPSAPSEPSEPSAPSVPSAPTEDPWDPAMEAPTPAPVKVVTGYSMTFFDPPSAPEESNGTVQWNDGYTSAELTAMKNEKQAEIKQLQFDIKMGKSELKIMQKEAADGKITAAFDGVVSDILEPAAALESGEPLMKVTGGGGYYVEGTVSELALNTIQIGQNVTVNSWDTGAVYTGRIVEIGSYPVEDQDYGSQNSSAYPYKVFIDESADLQEGFYVSMTCQTAEQAAGTLYLQNAFLRSEGNRSFVFVRNSEGLLEKRYLECGVSTDGYMTPIHSGITVEDFVAFPYGKQIVEGAPTYEGTDQDLYGY